jgi:DNA polymerase
VRVYVDLETYSSLDLKKVGVYRYVEAPDFEVLLCGWRVDDGLAVVDSCLEHGVGPLARWVAAHPDATFVAHNANFDRVALRAAGLDIPVERWDCTMAMAGEVGLPQRLEDLAKVLGGAQKDGRGAALVQQRNLPEDFPEEWAEFIAYCRQDVVALADIDAQLEWPTPMERRVYHADQRVNDRGIPLDREMAEAAVLANEDNRMEQELEVMSLTGMANPNSNPQFLRWIQAEGLPANDCQEETIARLAERPGLTETQRRVLELRQDLALVAVKKYPAALAMMCSDDRFRGGFRFFGAHTGRWSGRGVQPHNLPRAGFKDPVDEAAAILDLKLGSGASSQTLKMLVRALLVGPFTVVDYASIEARVIAWLAGEEWALQAFRDGRDIYVETAERMGGLTRAQGKVAVLALGFAGGTGSLRVMGAEGSDADLKRLVFQWRDANPRIVDLWGRMEEGFRVGGAVGDLLEVEKDGRDRRIVLPSGRAIVYHECRWEPTDRGMRATFLDPRGRTDTYGGRLTENVVQAVARDLLAEALVRLDDLGVPVAAHTHDEVIVEGRLPVAEIAEVMTDSPWWAYGLPMAAEGFQCDRYRKG